MATVRLGDLRERLVIQRADRPALNVASLTSTGTTATATTVEAHGYATGDRVTIAGASPAGYTGTVSVTVVSARVFTYAVTAGLSSPATGTITATYVSDALGGRAVRYRTLDTVAAQLVPLRASERLQAAAIQSETLVRFRVRARSDVTAEMRALWTPTWPSGAARQTLQITGVLPDGDGRTFMFLECSR